jgi:formylglycine-generating enzyme required for sulfatase activity
MLVVCPSSQCGQKVVLVEGYGKLPVACPRCGTDLRTATTLAVPSPEGSHPAGERALSLDGSEMVYVPPGPYIMGSDLKDIEAAFASACRKYHDVLWVWFERELPKHQLDLPGFWIDVVPVTCAQYKRFCDATGHPPPEAWADGHVPPERQNHPVVDVSWEDVLAYCSWVGKRPPYESEWEKAARGTDGRVWPWGSEYREDCGNIDRGLAAGTLPVGSFPQGASPYGCLDMAGNVFEWTRDICVQYPGYQETDELRKTRQDKTEKPGFERIVVFRDGVRQKEIRPFQFFWGVVRGGAWGSCAEYCRAAFRLEASGSNSSLGFRCVLGEDACDQSRDLGQQGRHEESLAAAERSLALSPNYPTALYNAGRALENLGRFKEAAAKFRHLVDVWPTDSDSWNRLGLCQSRLANRAGAIDSYDTAITVDPFNADFWYNKALELVHLLEAALAPHTIAAEGRRVMVDLPKVPVAVVQAVAGLQAEAAGCYHRARRLGAEDNDVVEGHATAKQQSQMMLDHLRGRLGKVDFARTTARVGFCESFPTIQHVWAVIRKYHADADFSYEPLQKFGFGDAETSTALTNLARWGRVETVALETFRVIHSDEISSYDPWREFV